MIKWWHNMENLKQYLQTTKPILYDWSTWSHIENLWAELKLNEKGVGQTWLAYISSIRRNGPKTEQSLVKSLVEGYPKCLAQVIQFKGNPAKNWGSYFELNIWIWLLTNKNNVGTPSWNKNKKCLVSFNVRWS